MALLVDALRIRRDATTSKCQVWPRVHTDVKISSHFLNVDWSEVHMKRVLIAPRRFWLREIQNRKSLWLISLPQTAPTKYS